MSSDPLLDVLNPPQREAVLHPEGPLLILAGAGSGKTRVITHRIAYGIREGRFVPGAVLAVTFTNKAAQEMAARVEKLCGCSRSSIWIRTFHATCALILRRHGEAVSVPPAFTIYDRDDQLALIKAVCKKHPGLAERFKPQELLRHISRAKDDALSPQAAAERIRRPDLAEAIHTAYSAYQEKLIQAGALDFGDLLYRCVELLENHPDIRSLYGERFRHILVDEYQDTNHAQYRIIKALARDHDNLCVVGDDDQSIYSWRGADIRNILDFERDFPAVRIVRLEQNYRSTPQILSLANEIISRLEGRMEKQLWSGLPDGVHPVLHVAESDREEALYVVQHVLRLLGTGVPAREIAVFYRTNWQSRVLEEALSHNGIPYTVVGGLRFYARKEIRDLLAYLVLAVNPRDSAALARALAAPARGIGSRSVEKIRDQAAAEAADLISVCHNAQDQGLVRGKNKQHALTEFANLITSIAATPDPLTATTLALEQSGLLSLYVDEEERLENLYQFQAGVSNYLENHPGAGLLDFLTEVSLMAEIDNPRGNREGIQLMTLHNAKGLEFDAVFITGLEDGLFPHFLAEEDDREPEEERRLFYVGITRARTMLSLSLARQRLAYGRVVFNEPSRFLEDIPAACLGEDNGTAVPLPQPQDTTAANGRAAQTADPGVPCLQPGDRVLHPQYGAGCVLARSGKAGMIQVQVDFDGQRCLFLERYSGLEKIPD